MSSIELIYASESRNRLVFRRGNKVVKFIPRSERGQEEAICRFIRESGIDPREMYFMLWYETSIPCIGIQNIPCELQTKEFVSIEGPYRGVDLYRLLKLPDRCRCCRSSHSSEPNNMKISVRHLRRFTEHIFMGVLMLGRIRVSHNDLRLCNILLDPTPREISEGLITESLPRIADFGMSKVVDTPEIATGDLVTFFASCKHGYSLPGAEGEHPTISRCWLKDAVAFELEGDKRKAESCREYITMFETGAGMLLKGCLL
jgi:serine/threonine protein kinase